MYYFDIDFSKACRAIGNGMTVVHSLYKCLVISGLSATNRGFEIHYSTEHQRILASCIPGVRKEQIIESTVMADDYTTFNQGWRFWREAPFVKMVIPHEYKPIVKVPKHSIAIHARERCKYDGGWGKDHQPERFVEMQPFFDIALEYANNGYTVFQIGTKDNTKFPEHENIVHLSHIDNKTLMDDLYVIDNCDVLLATDSGMWVCGVAFSTPTILSNSCHPVKRWWPKRGVGHTVLNKKLVVETTGQQLDNDYIVSCWGPKRYFERDGYKLLDNTYEELDGALKRYIK